MNRKPARLTITCLLGSLSLLASLPGQAGLSSDGSQWIVKSGDSLYGIARKVHPGNAKAQAQLRKQLLKLNPEVFRNGPAAMKVGSKLTLPISKPIARPQPAPVVKQIAKPAPKPAPAAMQAPSQAAAVTPDPADVIGKVIINVGDLQAENRGNLRSLERHSDIYKGDRLITSYDSRSQIRMKDGALVSLQPNTEFAINDYNYDGQQDSTEVALFELIKGGFRTITGAIGHIHKKTYQVKTSVATIGIRGTHYGLLLCEAASCANLGEQSLEDGLYGGVADGKIVADNDAGEFSFNNDQYFRLTSASQAPVRLLAPPPIFQDVKLGPGKKKALAGIKALAGNKPMPQNNGNQHPGLDISGNSQLRPRFNPDRIPLLPPPPTFDSAPSQLTYVAPEKKAPDGSAMLIGFNQFMAAEGEIGSGAPVYVLPINNNDVFLGQYITTDLQTLLFPIGGFEASNGQTHVLGMGNATLNPLTVGHNAAAQVTWGRWDGNYTLLENGAALTPRNQFHFMYSPNLTTTTQLANLGGIKLRTQVYSTLDGTLPTLSTGTVGTSLPTIIMDVDFMASQLSGYSISVQAGGQQFQASLANPVAFSNLTDSFTLSEAAGNTTCEGASVQCTGEASIAFVGTGADFAMTSYNLHGDTTSSNSTRAITGTALLGSLSGTQAPNGSAAHFAFSHTDISGIVQPDAVPVNINPSAATARNNLYLAANNTAFAAHQSLPSQTTDIMVDPNAIPKASAIDTGGNVFGVNWGRWDGGPVIVN